MVIGIAVNRTLDQYLEHLTNTYHQTKCKVNLSIKLILETVLNSGSYMSAYVLLKLSNKFGLKTWWEALSSVLSISHN